MKRDSMTNWIVYFVDEEGWSDYVFGKLASCPEEAIRRSKQELLQEGLKDERALSRCHSWVAVQATDKNMRRHGKWTQRKVM